MKEKIAKWYKQGLWDDEKVQNAVKKGVLTEEEAEEILAEPQKVADNGGNKNEEIS